MCDLLAAAGITVDGSEPWDVTIHDERVWSRVLRDGTLGAGEAYVDGWWDSRALDQTIDRLQRVKAVDVAARQLDDRAARWSRRACSTCRRCARAFGNGQHHYDIGNDLYEAMLDPRMVYTCAYWRPARRRSRRRRRPSSISSAARSASSPGMRVLDLGCGWGGFAAFAAESYGCDGRRRHACRSEQVALGKRALRAPADRHPARRLPRRDRHVRRGRVDRDDGARRSQELPRLHGARRSLPRARRRRVRPHDRRQPQPRATSIRGSTSTSSRTRRCRRSRQLVTRDGGHLRPRGRPQHRRGLRPDADGVVGALRRRVAASCAHATTTSSTGCGSSTCSRAPARSARARSSCSRS